jgi:hypothetical protein
VNENTATVKQGCVECGKSFVWKRNGPGRAPLICSEECRSVRRYRQKDQWRKRTECPPHQHGTVTGYTTYECDCDLCRQANTEYARKRRAKAREKARV